MKKPYITVLGTEFPNGQVAARKELCDLLKKVTPHIIVEGALPVSCTPEELARWAILGEVRGPYHKPTKSCDFYFGIQTPGVVYSESMKRSDLYDTNNIGELGFLIAHNHQIICSVMTAFNPQLIKDFLANKEKIDVGGAFLYNDRRSDQQ